MQHAESIVAVVMGAVVEKSAGELAFAPNGIDRIETALGRAIDDGSLEAAVRELISIGGFFLTRMKSPFMADEIARVLQRLHQQLTSRRNGGDAVERSSIQQIERWLPAPRSAAPPGTSSLLSVRTGQNRKSKNRRERHAR